LIGLAPERYPAPTEGLVIVWGLLAREPYGGMAWQVLHHLVGLRRLGFDVWYVEDSDALPAHPRTGLRTLDPTDNLLYLRRQLGSVGLANRWAYRRPMSDEVLGPLDRPELQELYRRADAVLNLCGSHELLPHHLEARNRVYVETDPFLTQVQVAQGCEWRIAELDQYHHLFTYGLNLGSPLCDVPVGDYTWHATLPPVVTDWWASAGPATIDAFTTVTNWKHTDKDVTWKGRVWKWSKHEQFQPFVDLPSRVRPRLEIAVIRADDQLDLLHSHGWQTRSAWSLADPADYRAFIRASRGEFSVAKEQYVLPRTGWISDRSICYLAAGRPVIVEDTGAGLHVPTGWGMLTFTDPASAVAAIERVDADYDVHAYAASELARQYFEAEIVLERLMSLVLRGA
jgi:hypothetical protein